MKKTFESLLIEHCAPTLAKAKTANLFRYHIGGHESIENTAARWDSQLFQYGVHVRIIKYSTRANDCLIYVSRENALKKDLKRAGVGSFLKECGYDHCNTLDEYLLHLSVRLKEYDIFPHEIGLFLGYPVEDVIGFVENEGRNYHYLGFWKVYSDLGSARKCFEHYKKCTDIYKKLYENGRTIIQLTVAA